MNHIENIEIKNFKSIKHASIKDCRRVNVFIGYPNVGKSNILEALGLYSIDKQNNNLSDLVRFEGVPTLFHNSNIETAFEIIVNDQHKIIGYFSNQKLSIKRLFAKECFPIEMVGTNNQIGQNGIDERWSLDINNDNESSFYSNDFNESLFGHYLSETRKYIFRKSSQSKEAYSFLSIPFGENLFFILSTNPTIRKDVAELFKPYNLRLNLDKTTNTIRIAKDLEDDTFFTLPFSMIADTLIRLIFHKVAISSNKESILLFEEPEAHMFPPYISKFTSEVTYDENGNQFFIATHSPFVMNDFMENLKNEELAIFTVGYEKETGETLIRKMDDEEMHEMYQYGVDIFLNLENFLPNAEQQ